MACGNSQKKNYTSAIVYRCTRNAVSQLNLLALELTQAHIVRLFFFSHSLDCISCGRKEMCDTPIGTTKWFTGQDRIVRRSWCIGGRGYWHNKRMQQISIKKSIIQDTTGWWRGSSGNCARNWNLTMRTSGICRTWNPSWSIRCTNFSVILGNKQIT